MTLTPGTAAECLICQKPGARNRKAPNKYCDATGCIQEGIDAGHIAQGRQEAEGPVPCCLAVAGAHTHRCETLLRVYSLAYSSHL